MNKREKDVMTVTQSVYNLTKQFSELRVEAQQLEEGDPRSEEIDEKMQFLALGVVNHLLLNELRVIPDN